MSGPTGMLGCGCWATMTTDRSTGAVLFADSGRCDEHSDEDRYTIQVDARTLHLEVVDYGE